MLVAYMLIGRLLGRLLRTTSRAALGVGLDRCGHLLTMLGLSRGCVVVARSIRSAAAAVALPLTLAVVRLSFAGRDRVRAMLIYNLAISVALLLSLLAVVIEELAGWRATLILPTLAAAAGSVLVPGASW